MTLIIVASAMLRTFTDTVSSNITYLHAAFTPWIWEPSEMGLLGTHPKAQTSPVGPARAWRIQPELGPPGPSGLTQEAGGGRQD